MPEWQDPQEADRSDRVGVGGGAVVQHHATSRTLQSKVKLADPVSTKAAQGEGNHLLDVLSCQVCIIVT